MKVAFYPLDEFGDIVQAKARLEVAEIAGHYLERLPIGGGAPARQPAAQRVVDGLAERPASVAQLSLELGRHIVIQRERRSHALMLR